MRISSCNGRREQMVRYERLRCTGHAECPFVRISFYTAESISVLFAALGAAYGTAKAGTGIAAMSVMRPELIMKSIIPVVMAGIIAIYGLVVAVLIAGSLEKGGYKLFTYVST